MSEFVKAQIDYHAAVEQSWTDCLPSIDQISLDPKTPLRVVAEEKK